jgi:hypothetical protein
MFSVHARHTVRPCSSGLTLIRDAEMALMISIMQ